MQRATTLHYAKDHATQVDLFDNNLSPADNAVQNALETLDNLVVGSGASGGWNAYNDVIPTRSSADDPIYVISFASVDLTGTMSVGMKIKWTQNGTVRYGIITAIAFSTNTTVTIYGGTDYNVDDTGTYAISDFYYSPSRSPLGFPLDPDKWTVKVTHTSNDDQASPTASTWYNVGSVSIDIPIGAWVVSKDCLVRVLANTASVSAFSIRSTLSTGAATNSDNEFHSVTVVSLPIDSAAQQWNSHYKEKSLLLAAKTTYYLNVLTGLSGATSLGIYGSTATTILKAVCAYL